MELDIVKCTSKKSGVALLKALPFIALVILSGCSNSDPIDIDSLAVPGEIPPGPGIIETQTGKKLEVTF